MTRGENEKGGTHSGFRLSLFDQDRSPTEFTPQTGQAEQPGAQQPDRAGERGGVTVDLDVAIRGLVPAIAL